MHLEESLRNSIRIVASKKKVSQSALVRKYLHEGLKRDLAQEDPALDIVGLGDGKIADLAKNHDHYLISEEKTSWKA